MIRFTSHSPKETEAFASELALKLRPGDVLAFRGGLGAGKTAFVRGLSSVLSPDAQVSSPTFALVNDYGGDIPLYHFDMYRIMNAESLETTGFYDYLSDESVVACEWSENIEECLPVKHITITINHCGENEREIIVEGDGRFDTAGN